MNNICSFEFTISKNFSKSQIFNETNIFTFINKTIRYLPVIFTSSEEFTLIDSYQKPVVTQKEKKKLSIGAIVGIVVGSVAFITILIVIGYRKKKNKIDEPQPIVFPHVEEEEMPSDSTEHTHEHLWDEYYENNPGYYD